MSATATAVFHDLLPQVALGYPVIGFTALMMLIVPIAGDRLVAWRGGVPMQREERARRYLDQLGPLAFRMPGYATRSGARRGNGRGLFRDMV